MKRIQLTQGQETFVSDEDEDLGKVNWHAFFNPRCADGGKFVAIRNTPMVKGKKSCEYMHRTILSRVLGRSLLPSEHVDHRDLNPLNNRRENLRLATRTQNNQNMGKRSDNTSGAKGVCWHKQHGKWMARIHYNGKQIHLGLFDDLTEASEAYCKAAIKYHGEFARLK